MSIKKFILGIILCLTIALAQVIIANILGVQILAPSFWSGIIYKLSFSLGGIIIALFLIARDSK